MNNNKLGMVGDKLMTRCRTNTKDTCQAIKDIEKKKEKERKEMLGEIEKRE